MFNRKKAAITPSGQFNSLFIWPFVLIIALLIINIVVYIISVQAGVVVTIFFAIYLLVCGIMLIYLRPRVGHDLIEFASNYSQVQRLLFNKLSIPYALLDNNGQVLWLNEAMQNCLNKGKDFNKNISSIIPEIKYNMFPELGQSCDVSLVFNERNYRVELHRISADALVEGTNILDRSYNSSLIAMYMFDETDINMYIQKLRDERFVVGLVYIDNYEDALEAIDDVRRSLFIGLVDKRVNKYFSPGAAIVRKMEKDKYLVVFRYKYLEKILADKFSILEDIKGVKIGNEMTLTLSIGVGTGASDYSKNFDMAKAAMDLALGRGGDQAVVKDNDKIFYFGGKSQQMEKNARVKVRVMAHALRQILETNERVLVMGHTIPDIDAFGSALGIYIIAKKMGKEAHIVYGEVTSSVRPFINRFKNNSDYPEDMFLTRDEAPNYLTPKTVVVVVDVNRPQRTECPELLSKCKTIINFDHHRRTNDTITGAVLSYIDPYASSACEMIAEMIQYVDDSIKLKAFEADAMYAGIIIDTDGFNNKSGPRTFEAAAFLRRNGADVTRVRKMLRNDMEEYRSVAEAVSKSEVYKDAFAITIFNGAGLESPTIGGAKAANELLDINGIKGSFVITPYEGKIFISARSIDEINVQLVMEKLGGGGHMSVAGAQLENVTPEEAVDLIKSTLDNMVEEGEV